MNVTVDAGTALDKQNIDIGEYNIMERFVNTLSWASLFMGAIVLCCASAKGMDIPALFILSIQASILMICMTANFIIEDEQEKNQRIIGLVNKLLEKEGSLCRFSFSHKWKVKI